MSTVIFQPIHIENILTCLIKVIGWLPIACASPMFALITDENGFTTPCEESNDTNLVTIGRMDRFDDHNIQFYLD